MNYFERFIFGKNISYAEEVLFPATTFKRCYKQHCTKVCGRAEYEFFCRFFMDSDNIAIEEIMKNVRSINNEVRFKMYMEIVNKYNIQEYYNGDNKDKIDIERFKDVINKDNKDKAIVKYLEKDDQAEDIFYIVKNVIQRYTIVEVHKLKPNKNNERDNVIEEENEINEIEEENENVIEEEKINEIEEEKINENIKNNKENKNIKDNNKENKDNIKENIKNNKDNKENIKENNKTVENNNKTVENNNKTVENNKENIKNNKENIKDNKDKYKPDLSINISLLISYTKHFISLPNATPLEVYKLLIILIQKYDIFRTTKKNALEKKLPPPLYKTLNSYEFQLIFYKKLLFNIPTFNKLIDILVLMNRIKLDELLSGIIDIEEIQSLNNTPEILSSYLLRKLTCINTKHFLCYTNRKILSNDVINNRIIKEVKYFDFIMVQNKLIEEQISIVDNLKQKINILTDQNIKLKNSLVNLRDRHSSFEDELNEYQHTIVNDLKDIIKENKLKIDTLEDQNIKLKEEILKNKKHTL